MSTGIKVTGMRPRGGMMKSAWRYSSDGMTVVCRLATKPVQVVQAMNGEQQSQPQPQSSPQQSPSHWHSALWSMHISCSNAGAVHMSIINEANISERNRIGKIDDYTGNCRIRCRKVTKKAVNEQPMAADIVSAAIGRSVLSSVRFRRLIPTGRVRLCGRGRPGARRRGLSSRGRGPLC